MALTISTAENGRHEDTAKLVRDYLKGAIKVMRRIDAVRNFYDKPANRHVERVEALRHMVKNPFRVADAERAGEMIDDAQRYYEKQTKDAPLKVKMDYAFGRVGAMLLRDTVLYGAAMAAGATAAAMNGGSPELICGAAVAAVGIAGVTQIGVAMGKMSRPPTKAERKHPETLEQYTEAKQALFVLKAMKKQLAPSVKNNRGKGGNVVVPMPKRCALR